MTHVQALDRLRGGVGSWLAAVAGGALCGVAVVAAMYLGVFSLGLALTQKTAGVLNHHIGPVWIPMFVVAMRVAWLAGRAYRTRSGRGALGAPVRPELFRLAPLFAALGLAGTVWGLGVAFDALDRGDFLSRLPALLAGLGAAMTSTLVGLGLQIATLLVASFNPAWSRVRVSTRRDELALELDGVALGSGGEGVLRLLDAVSARSPEALQVVFAGVPRDQRGDLLRRLWERTDSAIPIREVPR